LTDDDVSSDDVMKGGKQVRFFFLVELCCEEEDTHLLTPAMPEHDSHPLIKNCSRPSPTVEEKIFGMSLTQLLSDLGALFGTIAHDRVSALLPRIVSDSLIMIVVLIFDSWQGR